MRGCLFPFLHLNSKALTAPPESDLPCCHLTLQGKGGVADSPENGEALVRLFYDTCIIMITLATDLVQNFYTYW